MSLICFLNVTVVEGNLTVIIPLTYNRQMRGEDLRGLNLDELQQLEKTLESGLVRVLETKVLYMLLNLQSTRLDFVHYNK